MAKIELNDYSFEYIEQGNGEPVVFVHGSASDYRTWQTQQNEFAKHFRTIIYSRRYHWPNKPIEEGADYSMKEHIYDLEALLHSLNAVPAHLVGHSYGAFVCLLLASLVPRLVRSLVLAEPPAITLFVSNTPKPGELLRLLIKRPRTAAAIIKIGVTGFGPAASAAKQNKMEEALNAFGRAVLGEKTFENLSAERLEQARANLIKAELIGSGFPPINAHEVKAINKPTLMINGENSPALFHRLMDRLAELLPEAQRIKIPSASHIMHEDNSIAYNDAVLSFLKEQS